LTFPSLTLAIGSLLYLAMIPVSAYRYLAEERKAAKAKAQSAKSGAVEDQAGRPEGPVIRPSFRAKP
jgi:hypothetical protein